MKKQLLARLACVVMLAGCGHKLANIPPVPPKTQIVAFGDMHVQDGAAYAAGVVTASSAVVNRISKIEAQLRTSLPASADKAIRDGITEASVAGIALLNQIDTGALDTWPHLRDAVNAYVDTIRPLVDALRSQSGAKEKFIAVAQALVEILIGIAQPGAFAGCCQ